MTWKIKKTTWIVILGMFCLLSTAFASAQSQKYEALLGTWDIQTEDGAYTMVFEFSLDGEKLVGKYTGQSGTVAMEKLSFEKNVLGFTVNLNGMVIDYAATIVEDTLAGTLTLEYGQANIVGKKRKG